MVRTGAAARFRTFVVSLERRSKETTAMSQINRNASSLDVLFRPAAHYGSPDAVLNDNELSDAEKRVILSSWASDIYTVDSCPWLREVPGIAQPIRLKDILAALRRLDPEDDNPPP